jgi:DNA-binding transcriptional LysR family regulator
MDLELRHLRAFVAVVDEGTFTAAGAALGLSQASVSRAVAALERAVGAPVLHRTTREIGLAPTGARIIGHARRVLEEAAAIGRAADEAAGELRIGFHWAALGRHTTAAQHRWATSHPGSELRFVESRSPTAGLAEGAVDVAVLRRAPTDERLHSVLVGVEPRHAALAATDLLARRRSVRLSDFAGRTIAVDPRTGTTTPDLWPAGAGPAATRTVSGVDEWLTLIAAGQAVGITAEATASQHPRPGVTYRPVRDAQPVPVFLTWWRDSPPRDAAALVHLVCGLYAT